MQISYTQFAHKGTDSDRKFYYVSVIIPSPNGDNGKSQRRFLGVACKVGNQWVGDPRPMMSHGGTLASPVRRTRKDVARDLAFLAGV